MNVWPKHALHQHHEERAREAEQVRRMRRVLYTHIVQIGVHRGCDEAAQHTLAPVPLPMVKPARFPCLILLRYHLLGKHGCRMLQLWLHGMQTRRAPSATLPLSNGPAR